MKYYRLLAVIFYYTCYITFYLASSPVIVEAFVLYTVPIKSSWTATRLLVGVSSGEKSTGDEHFDVESSQRRRRSIIQNVCLIDDNPSYHEECIELSRSLNLPVLSQLPDNNSYYGEDIAAEDDEQQPQCFDHVLRLLPYEEYALIPTYALAIQALPSPQDLSSTGYAKRGRKKKKKPPKPSLPFYVDLCPSKSSQSKVGKRQQQSGGSDLLLKASGLKNMQRQDPNNPMCIVYDLTAGFGQDSLVMALSGYADKVVMVERDPIVAALLEDALRRIDLLASSLNDDDDDVDDDDIVKVASKLSKCLSLVVGESTKLFRLEIDEDNEQSSKRNQNDLHDPDVVYLDPMFPPRTKSAAVKKNMQILHGLLDTQQKQSSFATTSTTFARGGCDDEGESNNDNRRTFEERRLLNTALQIAKSRVVVKRPIKAQYLGQVDGDDDSVGTHSGGDMSPSPSYAVKGSTSRWDVYLI